jgi:hypothetical protein
MTWHYIFAKNSHRLLKYQRLTAHIHPATVEDQLDTALQRAIRPIPKRVNSGWLPATDTHTQRRMPSRGNDCRGDQPMKKPVRAGERRVTAREGASALFDEPTRPSAHLDLDRIKPVVEKINSHLDCRLRRIRLRGSARHSVVSSPALQRRMIRG